MRATLSISAGLGSMFELAQTFGFASASLMAILFAIWASWLDGPLLQRLDGQRPSNAAGAAAVVKLLIAAFVLSATGAVFAIFAWMFA